MALKAYKRVGLRRDRNLGDLSNSTEALNNILEGLEQGGGSFISEDLDTIRSISSLGLSNGTYREIIGSAEYYVNSSGSIQPYFPRITYQNKFDRALLFCGQIRINGGNGLTARYFNKNQVFENTVGIFSGLPFKTNNEWDSGIFTYSGKINQESVDVNGGVEWEGYFIPITSGKHNFYVDTTALTTFDFQTEDYIGDPSGTIAPFLRYYSASGGGLHFYTESPENELLTQYGYTLESTSAFFVYTTQVSNTVPLYRASNSSGPHLFTITLSEYNSLPSNIWTREGIVGYVYASAPTNITNQSVHRAYNSTSGDFLLTTSLTEATTSSGYTYQGIAFYATYPSYNEISRIGLTTSLSASGLSNTNAIILSTPSNTKYVGIGQSVSASGIVAGSVVASYDRDNGVIALTPPQGTTYALTSNVSGNITFYKSIGQTTKVYYTTYTLEAYKPYRIRFRYYIPQSIDAISVQRNISFSLTRPAAGNEYLRYNNLYDIDYDFSNTGKGVFTKYLDNSLNYSGGTLGGAGTYTDYVRLQTSKKIDIKYQPKTSVSDIIKLSISGTTVNLSTVLTISNTSGIEIGNYVFGPNIPDNTIVKEIVINNSIILSNSATNSGTGTFTFVDHRGFVKRAVGSGSAGLFTLSIGNTTDLKSGMIMIGSGVQAYTGITTTGSATVFNISPPQTIGAGTTVYFYQSRGLVNNALAPFCPPAANKCLFVSVAAGIGSTVIQVNDTTGISVGWTVQGYQFASGTTVTSIVSTGTTSISLSTGIINNLIVGGNFTVTNGTADKTLCCPPTDTSLPFNPTADGLETVSAARSLRIDSGNILFDALKVGIANTITTYSDSDVSTSRLSIQTPSGTFKLLCA